MPLANPAAQKTHDQKVWALRQLFAVSEYQTMDWPLEAITPDFVVSINDDESVGVDFKQYNPRWGNASIPREQHEIQLQLVQNGAKILIVTFAMGDILYADCADSSMFKLHSSGWYYLTPVARMSRLSEYFPRFLHV